MGFWATLRAAAEGEAEAVVEEEVLAGAVVEVLRATGAAVEDEVETTGEGEEGGEATVLGLEFQRHSIGQASCVLEERSEEMARGEEGEEGVTIESEGEEGDEGDEEIGLRRVHMWLSCLWMLRLQVIMEVIMVCFCCVVLSVCFWLCGLWSFVEVAGG